MKTDYELFEEIVLAITALMLRAELSGRTELVDRLKEIFKQLGGI